MTTAAILLAGGSGTRMRRRDNKVFATIGRRPMIAWSLRAFTGCAAIDRVVLVARPDDHARIADLLERLRLDGCIDVTTGGDTRHDSERAGIEALDLSTNAPVDVVAIHDTARPFAGHALIERTVEAARSVGGAVPVLPLGRRAHRVSAGGLLEAQPDGLVRVQTPQAFQAEPLRRAYAVTGDGFAGVDTVESVQRRTDIAVAAVPGDPENIKVTFADDLEVAQRIAARREAC